MDPLPVWAAAMVLVFSGASFFFALAETAVFSLGKSRATQITEQNPRIGKILQQLLATPQDLLAAMVLGNTFATAALIAVALWMILSGHWPASITIPSLLAVMIIGCEAVPKTLAVRDPERWALRIAGPLLLIEKMARPFCVLAQKLNEGLIRLAAPRNIKPQSVLAEEDYQELLDLATQSGALAESEREIILQIISLDRRTARDVMRPRSRMASIPDDLSVPDMVVAARKFKHRRLPMYDENPDTIVGILNTRMLLMNPDVDLADVIEFPSFVPESMNLLKLFKSLQRQQRGMAIVLDEFGGTAGLVTMEDILGELVGKLRSEGETDGFIMEKLGPDRWRVNGSMSLEDFRREHVELGDIPEIETIGGLMVHLLGVVPAQGEATIYRGLKLTAQITDERRVREVRVEKLRPSTWH